MNQNLVRLLLVGLTVLSVAACSNPPVAPPGGPSASNVNPVTGSRGGTNGGGSGGGTGGASAAH